MKRLLVGMLGVVALACGGAHRVNGVPAGEGPLVGFYKAAIDDGSGVVRRATISVWAERPDRLHAELIGPVGGVTFILDAGGGQACVVDVAAATAYAGEDAPGVIEALLGLRVSAAEAVAALLSGVSPRGFAVTREGGADGLLPEKIRIADGSRSVVLARVRLTRGSAGRSTLGTGDPPQRVAVRPIESLGRETAREPGRSGGDR